MRWLDDIINFIDMSLSKLMEIVKDGVAWRIAYRAVSKNRTLLSN